MHLANLSWIELIGENEFLEPLLQDRGIGLKDLKHLPSVSFLRPDLSREQLLLLLENIPDKLKYSLFSRGAVSDVHIEIPAWFRQYKNPSQKFGEA